MKINGIKYVNYLDKAVFTSNKKTTGKHFFGPSHQQQPSKIVPVASTVLDVLYFCSIYANSFEIFCNNIDISNQDILLEFV